MQGRVEGGPVPGLQHALHQVFVIIGRSDISLSDYRAFYILTTACCGSSPNRRDAYPSDQLLLVIVCQ